MEELKKQKKIEKLKEAQRALLEIEKILLEEERWNTNFRWIINRVQIKIIHELLKTEKNETKD